MTKKNLFQELQERNNPTGNKSTKKLDDDALNKLVDTIAPPVRPKKFQVDSDIPFLQQLADEQKKRGES